MALVVDRPLELGVPEVRVNSVREAMAPAAAAFYRDPTADLQVTGVTGTNGKTTTAFLIRELLEADGRQTGLLGTVKSVIGGEQREVQRTTPEAIDLQRTFREMLDAGDGACAIEVSSHALELHRVDGTQFAAAIFTNLTQDHLDFHETMEEYFRAKQRLFELGPRVGVINVDDPYWSAPGRRGRECRSRFALDRGADLPGARRRRPVSTGDRASRSSPTIFSVSKSASPLRGRFNVYNVLGALATVHRLGSQTFRPRSSLAIEQRRAGARQVRARRRGPGVRGAGRLRAHARFARERADRGEDADRGAPSCRVRLWRRP